MDPSQPVDLVLAPIPPAAGWLIFGGLVFLLVIFIFDAAFKGDK